MEKIAIKRHVRSAPLWLIHLDMEVKAYWCGGSLDEFKNYIRACIENTEYVKRSKRYPLKDCVSIEEEEDRFTIYTLYKNRPVVTYIYVKWAC